MLEDIESRLGFPGNNYAIMPFNDAEMKNDPKSLKDRPAYVWANAVTSDSSINVSELSFMYESDDQTNYAMDKYRRKRVLPSMDEVTDPNRPPGDLQAFQSTGDTSAVSDLRHTIIHEIGHLQDRVTNSARELSSPQEIAKFVDRLESLRIPAFTKMTGFGGGKKFHLKDKQIEAWEKWVRNNGTVDDAEAILDWLESYHNLGAARVSGNDNAFAENDLYAQTNPREAIAESFAMWMLMQDSDADIAKDTGAFATPELWELARRFNWPPGAIASAPADSLEGPLDASYRMSHGAPTRDSGASADSLEDIMPDYYSHPEYYRTGEPESDKESEAALRKIKGDPEADVTVYRAVSAGVTDVNPGDWVSLSPSYAKQHSMGATEDLDMPVISRNVKAKELFNDGNSINEFGWDPEEGAPVREETRDAMSAFVETTSMAIQPDGGRIGVYNVTSKFSKETGEPTDVDDRVVQNATFMNALPEKIAKEIIGRVTATTKNGGYSVIERLREAKRRNGGELPPELEHLDGIDLASKDKASVVKDVVKANIRRVFNEALERAKQAGQSVADGFKWYEEANSMSARVGTARLPGQDQEIGAYRGAGIVAALSPGTDWAQNAMVAQ